MITKLGSSYFPVILNKRIKQFVMVFLVYLFYFLLPTLCLSQSLEEVIYDVASATKELLINENTPCVADLETFFLDLVRARPWSLRSK